MLLMSIDHIELAYRSLLLILRQVAVLSLALSLQISTLRLYSRLTNSTCAICAQLSCHSPLLRTSLILPLLAPLVSLSCTLRATHLPVHSVPPVLLLLSLVGAREWCESEYTARVRGASRGLCVRDPHHISIALLPL